MTLEEQVGQLVMVGVYGHYFSAESDQYARIERMVRDRRVGLSQFDPRVTIDASLHHAADVDYYTVRGVRPSVAETVLLVPHPAVLLYNNEAPINLQVYNLSANGTPGALVASVSGGACLSEKLSVPLVEDALYLLRVSGSPGGYTLRNGVDGKARRLPVLVRDRIWEVLHPGEPVERQIRMVERYVYVAAARERGLRLSGRNLHLQLFEEGGSPLAEGTELDGGEGEYLSLAATVAGQVYALQVTPTDIGEEPPTMRLEWDEAPVARITENLIVNPGAEITFGDPNSDIPYWAVPDLLSTPRIFYYGDDGGVPKDSPGPADRGYHLFAGGPGNTLSGMQQAISVDPAWYGAINAGRVRLSFSGSLGGALAEVDQASATVTCIGANEQALGQVVLPAVTALDRGNVTGLLPVESGEDVPAGTVSMVVEVRFQGLEGEFNDGYADDLSLTLSEYEP